MRETVIIRLRRLVREMLQAIPLRASLRVYADFVVVGAEGGEIGEVDAGLGKGFAAEAGELHVVEGPIELDVCAGGDFAGGSKDGGWD